MIEFRADKVQLQVLTGETITGGSVGVYVCKFSFNADWNGYLRIAVFRSNGKRWEVALNESDMCVIPWEATEYPYCELTVGVYGLTNNGKVLPTVWASLGTVQPSPRRGKVVCPPSPTLNEQLYAPVASVTFVSEATNPSTVYNSIDYPFRALTVYGMAEYENDGTNLFNSATVSEDMWINTVTAEWERATGFWTSDYIPVEQMDYYLSCEGGRGSTRTAFYDANRKPLRYVSMANGVVTPQKGEVYFAFCGTEDTYNKVMFNLGTEAMPWAPFVGDPAPGNPVPIVTVGSGGTLDVLVDGDTGTQTLTLHIESGLAGVKVDSGGNYTKDGVQYLCDTYSFPSGVVTRYIGHIPSYNGEDVGDNYICNTGELVEGADVYYVMPEPVETEPNEDLGAYSTLRTYDGDTTVSVSDSLAAVSFKYVGDVQKYVDSMGFGAVVTDVEISPDKELIIKFSDGSTKNLGHVVDSSGAVYVPHISDRKILTFTIEKSPQEVPGPVDLNPFDEWVGIEGSDLASDYTWESL